MESMRITPISPEQTRPFLKEEEEILFIGNAREKLSNFERQRWIALTDQGRLLIFQGKENKELLSAKSKTLGRSLRNSFSVKDKSTSQITPNQNDEDSPVFISLSNLSNGCKQKSSLLLNSNVFLSFI